MAQLFWWIRQVILAVMVSFFLFFGIHLLISSYRLNDPFWFIMTFFSSNLIILISAVLLIGLVLRARRFMKRDFESSE